MQLLVRCIVIIAVLAGGTSLTYAGDPFAKPTSAAARDRLSRGNKFYSVRDFEKAIEEYKAGALAEQSPIFDYNLGQCYRQLGNYEAAKWHYQQFLRRAEPQGEVLKAVQDFIAQMDAELQKKAMSQPPTDAAPVPAAAQAPPARSEREDDRVARKDERQPRRSLRPLTWSLAGAGVIGLGVGGGLLWNASSLRDDASMTTVQSERYALYDKADTRNLLGGVIGVSGAALLTAGVITYFLDKPDDSRSASAWTIGISSRGVFAVGHF